MAAIGGRKDRIIFFNDIIKIWKTWVVGSYKYCTIVGFLVLIVESVLCLLNLFLNGDSLVNTIEKEKNDPADPARGHGSKSRKEAPKENDISQGQ